MVEFDVKYWAELRSRYKGVLWCVEITELGFMCIAEERRLSIRQNEMVTATVSFFFFFSAGDLVKFVSLNHLIEKQGLPSCHFRGRPKACKVCDIQNWTT